MPGSQIEVGPSGVRSPSSFFREVAPNVLDQVTELVAKPGETSVLIGLRDENNRVVLVGSETRAMSDMIVDINLTMPTSQLMSQTESGTSDCRGLMACVSNVSRKRNANPVERGGQDSESSKRSRTVVYNSNDEGTSGARIEERGARNMRIGEYDHGEEEQNGNGEDEEDNGEQDDLEGEEDPNNQAEASVISSANLDKLSPAQKKKEQQAKRRILEMDSSTRKMLEEVFTVRIKDREYYFSEKKKIAFTAVEHWIDKMERIKDDGGKRVLEELLACPRRLHQGWSQCQVVDHRAASQPQPSSNPDVEKFLVAVRNVAESETHVYLSVLKYRMNLLIMLRHYELAKRALSEDMHLQPPNTRARGNAGTAQTEVHTKFAMLLKDDLGGAADSGQISRAKTRLSQMLSNARRWNLLAQQCNLGLLFISNFESLNNGFVQSTLQNQGQLEHFGKLLKRRCHTLIPISERFWAIIKGKRAMDMESVDELDLFSETARQEMGALLNAIGKRKK
ncbi:hypothetical protein IWZ01DRAFT_562121 [Phyllosticta capitalensis]